MTDNDVLNRVQDIIVETKAETSQIARAQVRPEADLTGAPISMDSIDYATMIVRIEEVFGIIAEDEDFLASSVSTVGDVVEIVKLRLDHADAS